MEPMADSDAPAALSRLADAEVQLRRAQTSLADDRPEVAALLDEVTAEVETITEILEADIEGDETHWRVGATDTEEPPRK